MARDTDISTSLKKHEGLRIVPYQDSNGVWTCGYGRNLQTMKITPKLAREWLKEDIATATKAAKTFPEFDYLDTQVRQYVFIEMVFNLGAKGVSEFKKMLAAIREQDWELVADEMLDSKWAKQVGQRAITLAERMYDGR